MLQVTELHEEFDSLQQVYGEKTLSSIYGAGETENPKLMFVFMNPTGKNVSAQLGWKGLRAPWIGTKQVWGMFAKLGIITSAVYDQILMKKPQDWDEEFALKAYTEIKQASVYVTNLAKCTQLDARHLPDKVFAAYRQAFLHELELINPMNVVTFGNQVSTVLLQKSISVSEYLSDSFEQLTVNGKEFSVFPTYYPVGQGQRNMPLAVGRIEEVMSLAQ